MSVTGKIPLSGRPNNIAITPDGSKVYVAIVADGAYVDVIDIKANKVIKSIPTLGGVHNVFITPDGKHIAAGMIGYVIGKPARYVKEADALDYVFGYVNFVDVSARGPGVQQRRTTFLHKGLTGWSPMGPVITTLEGIDFRGSAKFTTPPDNSILQQTALLKICQ